MPNERIKYKLLKSGRSVPLRECLAAITGSAWLALVMQQMIFWSERSTNQDGTFWKSAVDLSKELQGLCGSRKIVNLLTELTNMNLLERKKDPRGLHRYLYTVNVQLLNQRLDAWSQQSDPAGETDRIQIETAQLQTVVSEDLRTPCADSRTPCADSRTACASKHRGTEETEKEEDISSASDSFTQQSRQPVSDTSANGHGGPADGIPTKEIFGRPVNAYTIAVDRAMAKTYAMASAVDFFGADDLKDDYDAAVTMLERQPGLPWNSKELENLQQIASFCSTQWPDLDPVATTACLIRGSFRAGGKPIPILRYWVRYNRAIPTLRAWLKIGPGRGIKDQPDFLLEIASLLPVQNAVSALARNPGLDQRHADTDLRAVAADGVRNLGLHVDSEAISAANLRKGSVNDGQ